ncbi:protelomerase family protein [Microcoleus sp. A003_D6]|uniref:protelomerase family protein n=1 Tax=Microcoleus sp. A003_D6 TaxID=3055266 RepID=UPI002FD3D607
MTIPKKLIADAQKFFNRVSVLTDKDEMIEECEQLLKSLRTLHPLHTFKTYLTEYRKPFLSFIHPIPELNETKPPSKGGIQCFVVSQLVLTAEEKAKLNEVNKKSSRAREGYDADGEIREVELPKTDIAKIIDISCECLLSDNPHIIAAGIVNLTGLRANEQNMPRYEHKDLGIIERQMVVVDDYVIGFKGVSKKRNEEDVLAFYARPTLAPAKLIVDAHNKYLSYRAVQAISTDINTYQKTFQQQFKNEYKKLFGKLFSTIEMFDDEGELTKENGTPHKGRAFYACTLRAILKAKRFGSSAINTYVQLSLGHDSIAETMKYLGRYDESQYINPLNINLPTNITGLGKMNYTPTTVENQLDKTFNLEQFIEGLDVENQLKIAEFLNDGMGETQAVLALFNYQVVNRKSVNADNTKSNLLPSKETVTDTVAQIVEGVMHYNRQNADGGIEKMAVPTYGLINKISVEKYGKQIASTTVKNYLEKNVNQLNKELAEMGIPAGLDNTAHNGKYHRKTTNELVATIIEFI